MAREPAGAGNGCTRKHAWVIGICATIYLAVVGPLGGWLWSDVSAQAAQVRANEREIAVLKTRLDSLASDITEIKTDVKSLLRHQYSRTE